MASRAGNSSIDNARRSVRSLARKDEDLQRTGGKLDKNGEPELTASNRSAPAIERDPASEYKKVLSGGPSATSSINLSLPGDDSHITGRVGGRPVGRYKEEKEEKVQKKKEEALLRPVTLQLPIVRSKRPENADGATSFHFAHEAISKTPFERTSERGTKTRKGSASDHARYIERDEALAKQELNELNKIEGDLKELVKDNPDLAKRLGLDEETSKKDKEKKSDDDISKALSVGQIASVYIEREEALAHNDNGIAVLFTNISQDAKERRDFWKQVEEHESDPSADVMRLTIGHHKSFWKKIEQDEETPLFLKRALQAGNPNEEIKVRTGDNQVIRKLMKKHGWKPPERRPEGETDQQRDEREEREVLSSRGAKFEDGRGGRVQFRIVGELPYDVPHEARIRILKQFSSEFEKRNLPYIAVMHAPDHTNDDRNWHFHLVYHDRPAKRFTGNMEDHLWQLPDDASTQVQTRHAIIKEALSENQVKKLNGYIGKWDFTIPYEYIQKCRHKKTAYPFSQNKNREANNRKFIPGLRRVLADLTNEELIRSGIKRRLDPRRYSEMGIHKKTERHLGTTNARLENMGIQTPIGKENEEKQWEYVKAKIEDERKRAEQSVDAQVRKWTYGLNASELSDHDRERVEKNMVRWEQAKRESNEHNALALTLEEHLERMKSRAKKVEMIAKKHLDAISANLATKRQARGADKYKQKLDEAQQHLKRLDLYTAEEFAQIAISRSQRDEKGKEADHYENIIEKLISEGQSKRRERENGSAPNQGKAAASKASQKASSASQADNNQNKPQGKSQSKSQGVVAEGSAMGNSTLDRYINTISKSNIRLVREEGWIVPKNPSADDLKIIGAANYSSTQTRLKKIKVNQDSMIADLAEAIKNNPGMVKLKKGANVADQSAAPSQIYRLASKDKRLQVAFKYFSNDEAVIIALKNSKGRSTKVASQTKAATSQSKPDVNAENPNEKKEPAINIERIISIISEKNLRPAANSKTGETVLAFSKEESILYDIPEKVTIEGDANSKRVNGIIAKNNRAVRRLVAYIEKMPAKVFEDKKNQRTTLVKSAPLALKKIADEFARDKEVKRAMENAVIQARLQKIDPRAKNVQQSKEQEKSNPSKAASDKPAAQISEPANKPARKSAENKDNSPMLPLGDDFQNNAENKSNQIKAENKTKLEPKQEPEKKINVPAGYRINEAGKLVIDATSSGPQIGGAKTVTEDKQAETDAKRQAEEEKAKNKPSKTILSEDLLDGSKTPKANNFIPLEKGIHPKIDKWMEADEKNDREARRLAAAQIRSDKKLLGRIKDLEPKALARFQRDWDGIDADKPYQTRSNGIEQNKED